MVIGGGRHLAGVEQTQARRFALTYPRRLGFGLGSSMSSWRTERHRGDRRCLMTSTEVAPTPSRRLQNSTDGDRGQPSTV